MALVVLTENDPLMAVITLARRLAYVLIPLSETLNKYFFSVSVFFDEWTGAMSVGGVTGGKNQLGQLCFIEGLLLLWVICRKRDDSPGRLGKIQWTLDASILALAIYLLNKSQSTTALVSFIVGIVVFLVGRLRIVRWRIAMFLGVAAVVLLLLEATIGVYGSLISALGKDPTLTNRTEIWKQLWALHGNWLVGPGFEGFWSTGLWSILKARRIGNINEAHNGYLEIFLSLGVIGLSLWLMFIGAAYKNCRRLIANNYDLGRISMTIFAAFLVYNLTESGSKGLSFILFFFFVIAIDTSRLRQEDYEEIDETSLSYAWAEEGEEAV